MSKTMRHLDTLEGVRQFEDCSSCTTGRVVGLFGFDLPGLQYMQNWTRGGIGVDATLGGGTATATVNVTTEGQDPPYRVSASYRIAF